MTNFLFKFFPFFDHLYLLINWGSLKIDVYLLGNQIKTKKGIVTYQ